MDRKRAEEANALQKVLESSRPKNAKNYKSNSKSRKSMIVKKFKPL